MWKMLFALSTLHRQQGLSILLYCRDQTGTFLSYCYTFPHVPTHRVRMTEQVWLEYETIWCATFISSLFLPLTWKTRFFRLVTHLGIVRFTLETGIKLRHMDSLEEANSNRWALHNGTHNTKTNQPAVCVSPYCIHPQTTIIITMKHGTLWKIHMHCYGVLSSAIQQSSHWYINAITAWLWFWKSCVQPKVNRTRIWTPKYCKPHLKNVWMLLCVRFSG